MQGNVDSKETDNSNEPQAKLNQLCKQWVYE